MKRILIDTKSVGGESQGIVTYIVGMYNAIHEQYGSEYELFFTGYHKEAIMEAFPFVDDGHYIQLPETNKVNLLWNIFPKIIEKYNIDYAHFQYVTPFRKNCKLIVTTHDLLFLDFPEEFSFSYRLKRKFLFKKSLVDSDIRLTVSNYSRERISAHFKISADTVHVTPNAVHDKFFVPFEKKEVQYRMKKKFGFENYLLYVKKKKKRKNHQLILDAYEDMDLASKGIQLVLVGNDTLGETKVVEQLKRLKTKHPEMVNWLPYAEEVDLLDLYRGAWLFLYPSLAEGFGIPPIEAAALGLETLCSNLTAMQDFTFFEKILFNHTDKERFKKKLNQLITQTDSSHLNTKNRNFIQEHYSWKKAAEVLHQQISKTAKHQTTPLKAVMTTV
ncbi:MAG: glycosyltransferase family 4 protein [Saprospiraceae bacterium]